MDDPGDWRVRLGLPEPEEREAARLEDLAPYRSMDCPACGRARVMGPGCGRYEDGVCEKCGWDVDGDGYAVSTRPNAACVFCRESGSSSEVDRETGYCETNGHAHVVGANADHVGPHRRLLDQVLERERSGWRPRLPVYQWERR